MHEGADLAAEEAAAADIGPVETARGHPFRHLGGGGPAEAPPSWTRRWRNRLSSPPMLFTAPRTARRDRADGGREERVVGAEIGGAVGDVAAVLGGDAPREIGGEGADLAVVVGERAHGAEHRVVAAPAGDREERRQPMRAAGLVVVDEGDPLAPRRRDPRRCAPWRCRLGPRRSAPAWVALGEAFDEGAGIAVGGVVHTTISAPCPAAGAARGCIPGRARAPYDDSGWG